MDNQQQIIDNRKKQISIFRHKLFKMVSVGVVDDLVNSMYDVISTMALIINLAVTIMNTYDELRASYGKLFTTIEAVTVFMFAVDYVLRLITAKCLYPADSEGKALRKYILSFSGVIDLLSFLPYYLPVFFPAGTAVFRMFRVARIFRLFRINAYYDSLNVITEVLSSKKQQLLSSVFIILILMISSSLCMYSVEHEAQPEIFSNAFSGIWWSASTLLTVGYGDIYPVTTAGKFFGIVIAFLGVGMVAIPTGIISAGFVEQYQRLKKLGEYALEQDVHFINVRINEGDSWADKKIIDLKLPKGVIVAAIIRGSRTMVPRGNVVLKVDDSLILGAESYKSDIPIKIKQLVLAKLHPWIGQRIKELDISRQSFIIMIKRNDTMLIPRGDTILLEGDMIFLYSKERIPGDEIDIEI